VRRQPRCHSRPPLIELRRDALQAGQKSHHVVTRALPEGHQESPEGAAPAMGWLRKTDGGEVVSRAGQPAAIDQAVLGIEPAEGDRTATRSTPSTGVYRSGARTSGSPEALPVHQPPPGLSERAPPVAPPPIKIQEVVARHLEEDRIAELRPANVGPSPRTAAAHS